MSFIQFDEESNQLRVFMPPIKKLPPNPHISCCTEPIQCTLAPPSEASHADREWPSEPREDETLQHELIACDQTSFLTGSASADLQAARLITAVRSNSARRTEVEALLARQRVCDPMLRTGQLNHPNNAILLEASLHVHWDVYGTFCFVPSESDAQAMLDALIAINTKWEKLETYFRRPLDVTLPPFVNPHWEVMVLHPHALLPNGQPLVIASDRMFYVQGQPPPTSRPTWTYWIAYDDYLRSATPPHDPLPPFIVENLRATLKLPVLSSLCMVINAYYKLDHFIREHGQSASPRVRQVAQQMSRLVTAIFYRPAHSPGPVTMTQASGSAGEQCAVQDHCGASSSVLRGSMHSDAVEPPEAVDDDGLTDTEFRLIVSKVKDPFLDPKERADAAMMMLFGTHQFAIPPTPTPHQLTVTSGGSG